MFASAILLTEALAFGLVCAVLPRLHRKAKRILDDVPTGMEKFGGSLIPGFEAGKRFVKIAPRLVPVIAFFALTAGVLGLYALIFAPPMWLNALAALSLAPFAGLFVLLFRMAKKYAPALKELRKAQKTLRL